MLLQSQKFALEHIYCAPAQDRQYSFKMARVNKASFPAIKQIAIYGASKKLPNTTSQFHVFVLGNLFPEFLNLQGQKKQWFKDQWIKMSDDMVARRFIAKIYNDDGMVYPRCHIYYSYIDENSLVIALEVTTYLRQHFDAASFKYLNVYSNAYFQTPAFNALAQRVGIGYHAAMVSNNQDKATLQTLARQMAARGGDVFVYVDGMWVDTITLNIPNMAYVEIIYDQSVISRDIFNIQGLRTFDSIKDDKLKYLLYRDKKRDVLEYEDDSEVYVSQKGTGLNRGLLFYRHAEHAMRNVTDKDYSLNSMYVNQTTQTLSVKVGGGLSDKVITLYTRHSGLERPLVYSAMKLHELYKLPTEIQRDVLLNVNYSLDLYRIERLENSAYFQVASADAVNKISPQLAIDAAGYNGITHAYANAPVTTHGEISIDVPELFQHGAIAFEYDTKGRYTGQFLSTGPMYTCSHSGVAYVDFMAGHLPTHYGTLYPPVSEIVTDGMECRILSAFFDGTNRLSVWEDITDNPNKCVRVGNTFTVTEVDDKKIKKVCLHHPRVYDLDFSLESGNMFFTLTQPEDRGVGVMPYPLDVPYENIEFFLNGHRLVEGLDVFIKFPEVSICNKRFIDYTLDKQKLHIRMAGHTLDPKQINAQEIRGLVNNGAISRNHHYDIRDDKVFSVYIDGKIRDRSQVRYSENDSAIRITHPDNGRSYVIKEPFLPIKVLTGVDSFAIYRKNIENNKKISDFYDMVHPEPPIDEFNTIAGAHVLFSSLVSTMINDMLIGVIPESVYSTPYDDTTILSLIENKYKTIFALDPIRANLQETVIEIHPHLGNTTISVSLLQYRFIQNVVRLITTNKPERINLSGYLLISTS